MILYEQLRYLQHISKHYVVHICTIYSGIIMKVRSKDWFV